MHHYDVPDIGRASGAVEDGVAESAATSAKMTAAAATLSDVDAAADGAAGSVDVSPTVPSSGRDGAAGAAVAAAVAVREDELRRNSWSMASRAVMRLSGSSSRHRRSRFSNRS